MAEYIFKYIIIGDSSVGKSCILLRFLSDTFKEAHEMTIGIEYGTKKVQVGDTSIKLQIWDTAGQESFHSLTKSYFRSSACCLLVYSIDNRESFNHCRNWLRELRQEAPDALVILIGNKCDLEDKRQVSRNEGEEYAEEEQMLFAETSALRGDNVEEVFGRTVMLIHQRLDKFKDKDMAMYGVTEILPEKQPQKTGFCC